MYPYYRFTRDHIANPPFSIIHRYSSILFPQWRHIRSGGSIWGALSTKLSSKLKHGTYERVYAWRRNDTQSNPYLPCLGEGISSLSLPSNTLAVNQVSYLAAMSSSSRPVSPFSSHKPKSRRRRSRDKPPNNESERHSDDRSAETEGGNSTSPAISRVFLSSCVLIRAVIWYSLLQPYRIEMLVLTPKIFLYLLHDRPHFSWPLRLHVLPRIFLSLHLHQ